MPLALAEQDISTDDKDASSSSTASSTPDDDLSKDTTKKKAAFRSCHPLPNGNEDMRGPKEIVFPKDVERVEGGGTDEPRFSCALQCRQRQRRIASRARICGLLVESGARRAWRRAPSEQQVSLHKKYAALLEDDDGRNLCTFSG